MKSWHLIVIILLLFPSASLSQINGSVTDVTDTPLPFVNIFIENTYQGTTTNSDGYYELDLAENGNYIIVFQYLGYKTIRKEINYRGEILTLDEVLEEENVTLDTVVIDGDENPANSIIQNAINQREIQYDKIKSFKANFYSRGLIKIKDAPEKILGQEIGDLGGGLDSTRSGIIYLSETVSKIEYLKPNKLKEQILASKVSGDETGFSFNNAIDVDYNFYKNTITFGSEMISPIANNAFNYYRFKLDGVFYDERGNLINKIQVTPKRIKDPVFEGYIYIIEDQWVIYAIELSLTGEQAKIPPLDNILIKQSFSYSDDEEIWAIISQSLDFKYGIFGIKGDGRFTAVYSDYLFNAPMTSKNFGRELVAFDPNANKKDSLFWKLTRPVPLTIEESSDYLKKDSIQTLKKSKPYLDSLDRENNKLKLSSILGYTYQNSHKNYRIGFDLPLTSFHFNTVQGYHFNTNLFFTKNYDEFRRFLRISSTINYGFSEDRLRATGQILYKFNDITESRISLTGGVTTEQFNPADPIRDLGNSIATLFFQENYMKLYDKSFLQLNYSEEWFNGFQFFGSLAYEKRSALFNTTDQTFFPQDGKSYLSNDPLNPENNLSTPFINHDILKLNTGIQINFGQNYLSYPNSKFNIPNDAYPTLVLGYEKGFSSSVDDYNFDQIKARVFQSFNVSNKGRFAYNARVGKFFNAEDIALMDFQHFNGNQINVSRRGNYTDVFNNLPYYDFSTNDSYFEFHAEHDFNGFILGKIPLVNKLNFNLVVGAHNLATAENKPYQELTVGLNNVGWGKWRFLRIDYVRSYQSGFLNDAIVFGLNFF